MQPNYQLQPYQPHYQVANAFGPGFFIQILFWGLLILGFVLLFKYLLSSHHEHEVSAKETVATPMAYVPRDSKYLDIVKERYAKGEINREEFEQKKLDFSA